jgi:predicted RNA-binding protein with TRAM domain
MIDTNKKRKKETPIKVGDLLSVTIESLGKFGEGVAKVGNYGFIVLVNGGVLGKTHYVQVTRMLSTYAFARVLSNEDYIKLLAEKKEELENE